MALTHPQRDALLRIKKGGVTGHKSGNNDFPHHKTLKALADNFYINKDANGVFKVTAGGEESLKA